MTSGSHPGYDGVFQRGPLAGKTVNVKTYSRHELVLDISSHPCDYYLVLTGRPGRASVRPWVIDSVFLFEHQRLVADLTSRAVKIGVATSIRTADWAAAQVPPRPASPLQLTSDQIALLRLFSTAAAEGPDDDAPTVGVLFDPEPRTWGLRGDPYLWRALRKRLADEPMPASPDEVARVLHATFEELTGTALADDSAEHIYRREFAHGGMSSGMISLETWRRQLVPMLVQRATTLLSASEGKPPVSRYDPMGKMDGEYVVWKPDDRGEYAFAGILADDTEETLKVIMSEERCSREEAETILRDALQADDDAPEAL